MSATAPDQLVLIDNKDTDLTLPAGIKVTSSGGGAITTALDLSASAIVNALSLGANDVTATNFSFTGSNGNFSTNGTITATGNINANSGTLATTNATGNLFNTNATTLNIGGAATTYTLGATTATGNIRGTSINFPNATALDALSALARVDSLQVGGGYGSTGLTLS